MVTILILITLSTMLGSIVGALRIYRELMSDSED